MEMDEEPKDVMVLNAIFKGKSDEKSIAKVTGLSYFDVVATIERLVMKGFIIKEEKKGLLGKKVKFKLTEKGFNELQVRRYELEQKWQRMVTLANNGDKQALQAYAENNRSWFLPMMMFGIMDMMMFMSMLSIMGLAMNHFIPEDMNNADIGDSGNIDDGNVDFGDFGDISF